MKNEQTPMHSNELQQIMDKIIQQEKIKNPFFPHPIPFEDLQMEDESLDEVMGAVGFNVTHGYLMDFYDDLKKFKVDEFLYKIGISLNSLFAIIQKMGKLIVDKSDKPILIQNKICEHLKLFNDLRVRGLILQVLFLQGLIEWFKGCDIKEGEKGYNEAQNLCNWTFQKLIEAFLNYHIIVEKDEHIRPLNEYLSTTEIGKSVWEEKPKMLNNIDQVDVVRENNLRSIQRQTQRKGGPPKKVIDQNMTLEKIIHEDLYKKAKEYYQKKSSEGKLKVKAQYGQLIREFAKKDWIKAEYKQLSAEQMRVLILNEFIISVGADTARRSPKGNNFEDLVKRITLQLPM